MRTSLFSPQRRIILIVILLTLGTIPVLLVRTDFYLWDFRNNLWAPAYLAWQGKSPYAIQGLFPDGNAVWLPTAVSAYSFVGLLAEPAASRLWLYITLAALLGLIGLAAKKRPLPSRLAFALLFVFLYAPTVAHLRLGQISILTTLWLIWAARLLKSGNRWCQGLLLTLASAKPQLLWLTLPGLLYKNYSIKKRYLIEATVWTGGFMILFLLPLFLANVTWWRDFVAALRNNPTWLQPSIWQLWPRWWGFWGWGGAILLTVLGVSVNFYCWHKLPAENAIYWSLGMTPLITPYVWSWDFTLQLPLYLLILFRVRHGWAAQIMVIGGLTGVLMAMSVALSTDGSNHRYWWLSWYLFAIIAAASFLDQNRVMEKSSVNQNK